MANEFVRRSDERLLEISKKLEERHLSYLQLEDTPLKLEQRQKLEGINFYYWHYCRLQKCPADLEILETSFTWIFFFLNLQIS